MSRIAIRPEMPPDERRVASAPSGVVKAAAHAVRVNQSLYSRVILSRRGHVPGIPSSLVDFGRRALQRVVEDHCMQLAASFALTTLRAIVPIRIDKATEPHATRVRGAGT
jgi:hypothetical protein